MSTLYLHIGPPKTGTTTIQNFLWENREVLEAHGICFPDPGYRYPEADYHRNGRFLTKLRPLEGQEVSHFEEGIDKLGELAGRYDSIILSDEGIWKDSIRKKRLWPRLAAKLKEKQIDLRIIMYLRRQDLWAQSYWAQKVKVGKTTLGFREYLEAMQEAGYPLDYCAYMDMLAGLFGKDSLIIRIMEKEQFRGAEHSLLSDFLDIFGLSLSDGFAQQQDVLNPKLGGTYLELKRTLNMLPWLQENRSNVFIGSIMKIQDLNPFRYELSGQSFFDPGEQKLFRDSFAESNRRLAEEYLGREDGVLFLEDEINLPSAPVKDSDLLHDVILVYGTILQTIMQHNRERTAEQKQTVRAIRKDLNSLSREAGKRQKSLDSFSREIAEIRKNMDSFSKEIKGIRKSMEANSFRGRIRRARKRLKAPLHSS